MEKEHIRSYRTEPTIHNVNVFHMQTSYRFFHLSCENCKLHLRCHDIKHKREICSAAKKAENILIHFTRAKISSFASDDFYVLFNKKNEQELNKILKFLQMKFMKKHYVRD